MAGQGDRLQHGGRHDREQDLSAVRRRGAAPALLPHRLARLCRWLFWLFFDSIRRYGNQGSHRQLWGAAISIAVVNELSTGEYASDPSFPAFYLAGQELPVANHRVFTALDPCRKDGAMCETGIDCCNGFCTNGVCGNQQMRCSETNEAC